jgi:extracellular elastinolytic metalloproteinase
LCARTTTLDSAVSRSPGESSALTSPAGSPRALLRAIAAAATLLAVGAPAARATEPETANFDARPQPRDAPPGERARESLRERLGHYGALSLDDRSGTLRSIGRLDGFLTPPSGRDGATIALAYVRDHADAFGLDAGDVDDLKLVGRSFADGIEHLSWEQRYRGIPAADAGLQAAVTGSGRLLAITGPPAADLAVRSTEPRVSAADAYAAARRSGGDPRPDVDVAARAGGAEKFTRFTDGGRASLAVYQSGDEHRLAWRLLAPVSSTGVYDVLVDARSGAVVRRMNHVKFAVNANVFEYHPDAASQVTVDFDPWLTSSTTLEGPNAHAFLDVHDTVGPQATGGFQLTPEAGSEIAPVNGGYEFPLSAVSSFPGDGCPETLAAMPTSACTWDPQTAGSWAVNKEQSATQLFYLVNTFHDHLRDDPDIAFVDGGFRHNPGKLLGDPNVGAPSDASDPVLAQALDGADKLAGLPDPTHVNNSNFLTLPDGNPGLMQMYLWKPPFGGYDGANDAATVFHEYTHGLSGRLVTDAAGYEALSTPQAGAMSEGWSDFYALDFLVAQGLQTDAPGVADVRFGRYLDNASSPLVRFQSIDCEPTSPSPSGPCPSAPGPAGPGGFTYGDFGKIDDGPEVHDDGEIWAQTLWSLRTELGVARARRYITEAMRLSPPEPSFLDMRNAIVQAAETLHPGEDWDTIWSVFASRGMGWSAATDGPTDISPHAATDVPPPLGSPRGAIAGTIEDELGARVSGVSVAVGGHDTGLDATDIRGVSGEAGTFLLANVFAGSYTDLYFRKPGYQELTTSVTVAAGETSNRSIKPLRRDYASAVSGGSVASFTGANYSASGCGPAQAIDDEKSTVWSTDADAGAQDLVIDLGRNLDLGQVRIDPRAGCGDPPESSLATYELAASNGPGAPFEAIASGTVGSLDARGYATLPLAGDLTGRRLLRLRAIAPRDLDQGGAGPFMDVSELEVTGTPTIDPTPTPTPTPSATPTPTPQPPKATPTVFDLKRLTASRKGVFKVKVRFGSTAPSGNARLRVLVGKRRFAEGRFAVRQSRTVTKTLTLNAKGRKAIKPGKSRKVTLELRLPNGQKLKKSVTLARRKR